MFQGRVDQKRREQGILRASDLVRTTFTTKLPICDEVSSNPIVATEQQAPAAGLLALACLRPYYDRLGGDMRRAVMTKEMMMQVHRAEMAERDHRQHRMDNLEFLEHESHTLGTLRMERLAPPIAPLRQIDAVVGFNILHPLP